MLSKWASTVNLIFYDAAEVAVEKIVDCLREKRDLRLCFSFSCLQLLGTIRVGRLYLPSIDLFYEKHGTKREICHDRTQSSSNERKMVVCN